MAKNKFIELTLGNYTIHHGFNEANKEHKELFGVDVPKKVLLPTNSIVFIDEEFIVTKHINDRLIYWEYHNGYDYVKNKLAKKNTKPF
jgi:hypothetical protein